MSSDTLITIMWTVMGAVATSFLGLLFWGVKKLITTTFENTVQIKLLNQHIDALLMLPLKVEKLDKDVTEAHNKIRGIYKNTGDN